MSAQPFAFSEQLKAALKKAKALNAAMQKAAGEANPVEKLLIRDAHHHASLAELYLITIAERLEQIERDGKP